MKDRLHFFKEKQLTFGFKWDNCYYEYELSVCVLCFTFEIWLGKRIDQ